MDKNGNAYNMITLKLGGIRLTFIMQFLPVVTFEMTHKETQLLIVLQKQKLSLLLSGHSNNIGHMLCLGLPK